MWASWLERVCVVVVCWMRAWARVCGSGVGALRAIVVADRAVRAVEPSGVRCERRAERMCASLALGVTFVVSVCVVVW